MKNQQNVHATTKADYIKPALIDYGSLAEHTKPQRTRIFGLPYDPIPDNAMDTVGSTLVSVT